MALPSEQSYVSYTGNNSTVTPYPIPFKFYTIDEIVVNVTDVTGAITTLTLNVNYTVSGGDPQAGATGSILTIAAIPFSSFVELERELPIVQETNFKDIGKFPSSSVDRAFDYLTMICQQLYRQSVDFAATLFATSPETIAGVLTTKATTPAGVKDAIQAAALSAAGLPLPISYVNGGTNGDISGLSTEEDVYLGQDNSKIVTPASGNFLSRDSVRRPANQFGLFNLVDSLRTKCRTGQPLNGLFIGDSLTYLFPGVGGYGRSYLDACKDRFRGLLGEGGEGFSGFHYIANYSNLRDVIWGGGYDDMTKWQWHGTAESTAQDPYWAIPVGVIVLDATATLTADYSAYEITDIDFFTWADFQPTVMQFIPWDPRGVLPDGAPVVHSRNGDGTVQKVTVTGLGKKTGYTGIKIKNITGVFMGIGGISLRNREGLVTLHRFAYGGAKAEGHAAQNQTAQIAYWTQFNLDFAVICLGQNDDNSNPTEVAAYKTNMQTIITRLRSTNPPSMGIVLMKWWTDKCAVYEVPLKQLAEENSCIYVDINDIILDQTWSYDRGLSASNVFGDPHMTLKGSEYIGNYIADILGCNRFSPVRLPQMLDTGSAPIDRQTKRDGGISFDSANASASYGTLPDIGTKPFSIRFEIDVPDYVLQNDLRPIVALNNNPGSPQAAKDFLVFLSGFSTLGTPSLKIQVRGATVNDGRIIEHDLSKWSGQRVSVVITRDKNGLTVIINERYVSIGGENTFGTPPAWATADIISSVVVVGGYYFGQYAVFNGNIYDVRFFLGSLSFGDIDQLQDGTPGYLQWSAGVDVASGSLVVGKRYYVNGGTSITSDSVVHLAGTYFTATATTYTESGSPSVFQAGCLLAPDLDYGLGDPAPDTSSNAWVLTKAGTVSWVSPRGSLSFPADILLTEISDPAAPAANKAKLYSKDNGSGKTQLVVRFPTGAVQVIATEP